LDAPRNESERQIDLPHARDLLDESDLTAIKADGDLIVLDIKGDRCDLAIWESRKPFATQGLQRAQVLSTAVSEHQIIQNSQIEKYAANDSGAAVVKHDAKCL